MWFRCRLGLNGWGRQISACGRVQPTSPEVRRGRPQPRTGLAAPIPSMLSTRPASSLSQTVSVSGRAVSDSGSVDLCSSHFALFVSFVIQAQTRRDRRPGAAPNRPAHQLSRDVGVPRRGTSQPLQCHARELQESLPRTKDGRPRGAIAALLARAGLSRRWSEHRSGRQGAPVSTHEGPTHVALRSGRHPASAGHVPAPQCWHVIGIGHV
jgi:hypothetical protein